MVRHNILDVRDEKLSKLQQSNPWGDSDKDVALADMSTIREFHTKYREGQITAEELVTAIDELICW